jgi:type II secretory ATPase GspE/PulE/Tfp pilus assembly ATPase PilB-like protein
MRLARRALACAQSPAMKQVRLVDRGGGTVTVGLLDGSTYKGRMALFSPYNPNLIVESERGTKAMWPVEKIAFVAFHAEPGVERAAPLTPRGERLKAHVAGGAMLPVVVDPGARDNPVGFYASPAERNAPFEEAFFYHHGLNAVEKDELLGDMLVRDGVVPSGGLQQGVDRQSSERGARIGDILVEQAKLPPESLEEALQMQQRKRMRLGEVLVEAGLATAKDIDAALEEQKKRKGKRLGQVLVEMGILNEQQLSATLAKKFHMQFVDLDTYKINPVVASQVPLELVKKYGFVPLDGDERSFTVAIADPLATEVHDALRFHLRRRVVEHLATPTQLKKHVERLVSTTTDDEMGLILKELSTGAELEEADDVQDTESDSATIKLANQIIIDAFKRGASDIHVEPNGKDRPTRIRFRVDGDCYIYQEIQPSLRGPLVARFKIMSKLDISERRKPQDGKIRFRMADRQIELRVATIPTVNANEDVVLRILAGSKPMPLERMGMSPRNLRALQDLIAMPYGMILCVGPTGSGKTTTLHSALGAINTADMKIWTAEDPVEITQPGLRQVQVQPKIGFTFANAMRAFLRADPDVIMIGEMRDQETASTAVEASLTGHLVFSTLHTNSAPETVTRMLDMGLDPFSFADALLGVLAQRLARGLCPACRQAGPASPEDFEELARAYGGPEPFAEAFGISGAPELEVWRAKGCETCGGTGYKGRVALHELLVVNEGIKLSIHKRSPVEEVRQAAMAGGMTTLLQDGVAKIVAGQTDLKQVLAVCSR